MPPVPGVAGIAEVVLLPPALVDSDRLPAGIVERGGSPGSLVAGVELPLAIERRSGAAHSFNKQGRDGRGSVGES